MFFKQVYRNAAKNRNGNGLFFASLVIAIVAFYTLLSLGEQDVMRFLATIESDAVQKLLMLLPAVYVVSLFFLFFLVYFACKYQTENRRREFGMYLTLGMKRSRLFFMLFCETLWSSLISLLIGLPAALFLTEGISLATAKLAGLGVIEHRFSFSVAAMVWTVCGFVLVQLLAMLVICLPLGSTEPAELLKSDAAKGQSEQAKTKSAVYFALGAALLLLAYYLGVFYLGRLDFTILILLLSGIAGTFFLYLGLGGFLGRRIRRKAATAKGLGIFTGRQVQEHVLHQHNALAIASLLLLLAMSCVAYGSSMGLNRASDLRSSDFSLFGSEKEISAVLDRKEVREMVKASYPIYLSGTYDTGKRGEVNTEKLAEALRKLDGGESIAGSIHCEYMISEGSYNAMMQAMGKKQIDLTDGKVALYSSLGREGDFYSLLDRAVKNDISVEIGDREYVLYPELCYDNIVADRAITLYTALIVPDALYTEVIGNPDFYCWNLHLKDTITEEMGLMQAIRKMNDLLSGTGLQYDSYLSGIGRNLFYSVSASYLTIYLGVLFLLISNTVIGLKYLIWQRQNKHRYLTLLMLGAGADELCTSVKKQIVTFFALVLGVAAVSSAAAVLSFFRNLTRLPFGTSPATVILLAGLCLLAVIGTEVIYICVVEKTACREIRLLEAEERGSLL